MFFAISDKYQAISRNLIQKQRSYGDSNSGVKNIGSVFCPNLKLQYLGNRFPMSPQILVDIFYNNEQHGQSQKKTDDPHDPTLCGYVSILKLKLLKFYKFYTISFHKNVILV